MSNWQFIGGAAGLRPVKLTTADPTVIVSENNRCTLVSVTVTEVSGNTPTCSVGITDGSTTWWLAFERDLTANGGFVLDAGWPIDVDYQVVAEASAANQVDVVAVVVEPDYTQ